MCDNLSISDKLTRVREKLNSEKVQLWIPPYFIEGIGPSESDLQTLASRFSATLGMSKDCCMCALSELQSAALENLESRHQFNESGTASFKVKIPNGTVRVSARLDENGDVIMDKVAEKLEMSKDRLRIIGKGKLLIGSESLASQGVTNNQKFLVIIMEEDDRGRRESEAVHRRLQSAKDDALLLMQRENKYMTMEDQDGNAVHLPPDEQKALMLALAIHEKGKSALKRHHYNEALYFLLEADTEFSHCKSGLLSTVDNYALLYLDIVWCYLKLRSADYLEDAARRLKQCEDQLIASYGLGMRRVEQIKGNSANERCLLMRLHLMQGIVAYHQNKRDEARIKFNEVQMELQSLKIDEDSLQSLIEMGFTEIESRIALREAIGNMSDAVTRIYRKREDKESARKTAKKERKVAKRKGGNGNSDQPWVNPKTLTTLTEMGYEIEAARIALRESDNDIERALLLLSDIPGLLAQCPIEESTPECENLDENTKLMDKVLKLIPEPEKAVPIFNTIQSLSTEQRNNFFEQAHAFNGDKMQIINILLESFKEVSSSSNSCGEGGSSKSESSISNEKALEIANKLVEEQSAYDRFAEDISFEEDDHLDFPLVDEEKLLIEYISVLGM